ncbi:MAG: TonB-dependent receptor plug domain-containing protein [Pseudomonadota bacterium]
MSAAICAGALLFGAWPLCAQTVPSSSRQEAETLDRIVVSASALPTTAAAATQHVTLLLREDLDAMRGLAASEILARQAGLTVDRGPRSGGYGALYLRGADPSHVVVLIDGIRQNDPLSSRGSAVDLNTLSADDIERIEIVRGNASVANAEAMAGLIHIFTRRGASGAGAFYGGDGLRGAQAAWGGDALRFGVAHREDGDGADGFNRVRAANGAWEQDIGERVRVQAAARYSDSENLGYPDDSGGPRRATLRGLESRRADSRQVSLRAEGDAAGATWDAHYAHVSRHGDEDSPGVAPGLRDPFGLPPLVARTDYRRDELQASWRREWGETLALTAGVLHQRETGRLDSAIDFGFFVLPARFALRRDTDSAFAEARWRTGAWTLQGGLRHERSDGADATTHPMLSVQRRLGDGGGHWGASIARSAKQPSFYALGHPLVGDPSLKPERALHRELYYATAADATWPLRLTLFSARYRDLIDFDAGPPPRLVNRARIEADGLEWRLQRRFDGGSRLHFEGAWMRVRDPVGDVALRHRPRLQVAAGGRWPIGGGREFDATLRHLGRRFDSSIPTGDRWLAPATVLDLSLRQSLGPVDLQFALDNALDTDAEESIGSPVGGRRLRLSLHWRMP